MNTSTSERWVRIRQRKSAETKLETGLAELSNTIEKEAKTRISLAFSSIRDKKEYPINTPYNCLQTFFFI